MIRWCGSGEKTLGEMVGFGGLLGTNVETQCIRILREFIKVTLAKTPSNGGMEPEPAIFCNQARLQVERLGHPLSDKTVNLHFVLPSECSGTSHISFVIYNMGRDAHWVSGRIQ